MWGILSLIIVSIVSDHCIAELLARADYARVTFFFLFCPILPRRTKNRVQNISTTPVTFQNFAQNLRRVSYVTSRPCRKFYNSICLGCKLEAADTEFGHGFGWGELLTFLTVSVMLFVLVVFSLCLAFCKREENRSNVYTVRSPRDDTRTMEDLGLIWTWSRFDT